MKLVSAIATTLFIMFTAEVSGLTGRVIAPNGSPLGNAHVSIAGRPATVTTGENGNFVIAPDPQTPFTITVIGPHGEIYQPIEVAVLTDPLEVRLSAHASEAITVTTGVAPDILSSPAAATTFIGREDLEQRASEHLVDAVARVAGVDRRGEGPPAVPVIRGLGGGRTAIIIDDVRVTAERRAGPSATFLDPFKLASIEIARGPGSVAYGSDAFGGIIHARSREPRPGVTSVAYELTTGFAASDTDSAGLSVSTPVGPVAALLTLSARDSDGAKSSGGRPITNSQYDATGGSLRLVLPTANGSARAALSLDRARNTGSPGADSTATRTYYPEEDADRLTFGIDRDFRDTRFEVRAALARYAIVTNRERLPDQTIRRQISSAEVTARDASLRVTAATTTARALFRSGLDVTSRFDLSAAGSVTAFDAAGSVESRRDEVAIENAARHDIGLFLISDLPVTAAVTFSAGARLDALSIRNEGGYFGNHTRSDTTPSGHVAMTWARSTLSTTLQVGSGFREPTLSDRYFRGVSGRGFVVGNPELEPERSLQVDYTARWQRGQRAVALFAYEYRIRNLVERYASGVDFAFRNRGRAEVRGLELEVSTPFSRHLSGHANISVARGESSGSPLDDITPLKTYVEMRWGTGSSSLFAGLSWFGADDSPGPLETVRPSHQTLDLGAGWKLRESADLRLAARNVLDELYAGSADANAALAQGRAVILSVHGRF